MKDIYEDLLAVASSITLYNYINSYGGGSDESLSFASYQIGNETEFPVIYDSLYEVNYGNYEHTIGSPNEFSTFQEGLTLRGGIFGLIDMGNSWTFKSDMLEATAARTGSSINGDCGIVFGSSSTSESHTQRFCSPTNIWSYRLDNPAALGLYDSSCLTFNSDISLECYGGLPLVGTTYTTTSSEYSDSQQSWTLRTQDLGNGRIAATGCSLTSDYGIVVGGYNSGGSIQSNKLYSLSSDIWIAKPNYLISASFVPSVSFTVDRCLLTTGYTTSITNYSAEFVYSRSTWEVKSTFPVSCMCVSSASMTSDKAVFVGGMNSLSPTKIWDFAIWRFDSTNTFTNSYTNSPCMPGPAKFGNQSFSHSPSKATFFGAFIPTTYTAKTWQYNAGLEIFTYWGADQANNNCPVPISKKYDFMRSINLTNTKVPIKKVLYVISGNSNKDVDNINFDISLDGGKTWKEGINQGSIIDTSNLSPDTDGYYKLKVKSSKYNTKIPATSIWTYKADPIQFRREPGSFSLGTNEGLYCCGRNPSTSFDFNSCEKYTISSNSFTSKANVTGLPRSGCSTSAASINSENGFIFGGRNSSTDTPYAYNERYSNSRNIWLARTTIMNLSHSHSVAYNWDMLSLSGGWNGSAINKNYLYINSYDTYVSKTNMPQAVSGGGISQLNGIAFLVTSGTINESSPYYAYSQRFNILTNSWETRAAISYSTGVFTPFSGSLGSYRALLGGGVSYPKSGGTSYWRDRTNIYSDSYNVWMLRENMPYINTANGAFSPDGDNVIGMCNGPSAAYYKQLCFISGSQEDQAFVVKVLE